MAQPFSIAYRALVPGDIPRPILGMQVTGINGRSGIIFGIVDSGADTSAFPFGYASLMGYTAQTLTPETYQQVGGTGTAFRALTASQAVVPEIPTVTVPILPLLVQGAQAALWGRMDFMTYFDVAIYEAEQRFTITPR